MTDDEDFGMDDFLRRFWEQKVAWKAAGDKTPDGRQVIRSDGWHYIIADEARDADRKDMRGFGGRHFVFQLHDGTIIESTNVWCQGEIPAAFLPELPDNARFLADKVRWG